MKYFLFDKVKIDLDDFFVVMMLFDKNEKKSVEIATHRYCVFLASWHIQHNH